MINDCYYTVLADLWRFDLTTLTWTYLSGSTVGGSWSYGSKNVETASNQPPPRKGAGCWADSSGNFFLFGGLNSINNAGKPAILFDMSKMALK
jgi:hypothetical protein